MGDDRIREKNHEIHVGREGTTVVMVFDRSRVIRLPYQAAMLFARAITEKAREAERADPVVVRRLIDDQAVLIRAGASIALTDDPAVMREAVKEAVNDRTLRRALPNREIRVPRVGIPNIVQHPPKGRAG